MRSDGLFPQSIRARPCDATTARLLRRDWRTSHPPKLPPMQSGECCCSEVPKRHAPGEAWQSTSSRRQTVRAELPKSAVSPEPPEHPASVAAALFLSACDVSCASIHDLRRVIKSLNAHPLTLANVWIDARNVAADPPCFDFAVSIIDRGQDALMRSGDRSGYDRQRRATPRREAIVDPSAL